MILATAALGVAGWGVFMAVVTNQEKLSSSVVKQIMRSVREDEQLKEALGEAIRPQPEWWLNGDPRINGRVRKLLWRICPVLLSRT
jgi:cytochrome c oxidase assembly factor 1